MLKNFTKIDLPILPLYNELTSMLNKNLIQWGVHNQICINSVPEKTDNIFYGAASLEYDWDNIVEHPDGSVEVPKRKIPLLENDFTEICDVFVGTQFEIIYKTLSQKYKLGRVRIMQSKPKTCLTWHNDPSLRLHFPMKTQEGCYMVIEDEVLHLEKDTWWLTNTTVKHTAFNGSKEPRIHLVACILD